MHALVVGCAKLDCPLRCLPNAVDKSDCKHTLTIVFDGCATHGGWRRLFVMMAVRWVVAHFGASNLAMDPPSTRFEFERGGVCVAMTVAS